MKAVVQLVESARCSVDGKITGEIDNGYVVFLGCGKDDDESALKKVIKKLSTLRICKDSEGKMNLSLAQSNGSILLISQFTLYGDVRHGNRPSFSDAMPGKEAIRLYEAAIEMLRNEKIHVETGMFGEHMKIEQINDGPVTIIIDSEKL